MSDPGSAAPLRSQGLPGVTVAGCTALVSGVSVFVNGYGVHAVASPSVYTTAKNLVAAAILAAVMGLGVASRGRFENHALGRFVSGRPGADGPRWRTWGLWHWLGLAYVGIVGGGVAFVAFFDGLADSSAAPAAFWRDTLVLWVGVLAVPFLRERIRWWNVAAALLLVIGEVVVSGGVGHLGADHGELLVLGSTVLWAVEVVVAKRLLRDMSPGAVGLVRMAVGGVTLAVYLTIVGSFGALVHLDLGQVGWAVLTGLLLAVYVGTWMTGLARARAVDVASILVASALVTWFLELAAGTVAPAPDALGLLLVLVGAATVLWMGLRGREARRRGATGT